MRQTDARDVISEDNIEFNKVSNSVIGPSNCSRHYFIHKHGIQIEKTRVKVQYIDFM